MMSPDCIVSAERTAWPKVTETVRSRCDTGGGGWYERRGSMGLETELVAQQRLQRP